MQTRIGLLRILLIAGCGLLIAPCAQATTYYVTTLGNDANSGTLAQPFRTIRKGINTAADGDTIVVSSGTFAEHISWSNTSLILQGQGAGQSIIDAGGNGTCLTLNGVPGSALIKGFTLQGGNTTAPNVGGGMYLSASSPTVTNCTFQNNQSGFGGGMFNDAGSSPTVIGCTFQNNSVPYNGLVPGGGAICNASHSSPYITDCIFTGNSDGQGDCGGISNLGGKSVVTNCLFTYNSGDAIAVTGDASVVVTNCTLYGNGDYGIFNKNDGIDNFSASVYVSNCIIWQNGSGIGDDVAHNEAGSYVANSDVQGGTYGGVFNAGGNINVDPKFIGGGNFRLQATSPCINKGSAAAASLPVTDLDGAPRILGGAPDMGAYEFWTSAYGQWFVDKATGNNTTGNGSPAAPFRTVVKAITIAGNGNSIYIKAGNYGTDKPRITKSLHLFNWGATGLARIGAP